MVAVAQLVRAPDCGSGGCGFNPRQPPLKNWSSGSWERLTDAPRATVVEQQSMSVAQLVEHRSPNSAPLCGAVFLWVTACLGRHHWHPLVGVDRQSNSKVELSFFHTSSGSHAECRVNEGAQVRGSRGSVPVPHVPQKIPGSHTDFCVRRGQPARKPPGRVPAALTVRRTLALQERIRSERAWGRAQYPHPGSSRPTIELLFQIDPHNVRLRIGRRLDVGLGTPLFRGGVPEVCRID